MNTLGPRIYEAIPYKDDGEDPSPSATAVTLNEARVHPIVRRAVYLLLGGVALLHLLACANVISLLLGQAITRRREAAVRLALGSGPRRLFVHYFVEAAALVVAGGLAGMLVSVWISSLMGAPADM